MSRTESELRLRSEGDAPSASRSARIAANRAAAVEERQRIEAEARTAIVRELDVAVLTPSQQVLVNCWVSASTELDVLFSKFRRCVAGEHELQRLALIRSQLVRIARALGLPKPQGARGDDPAPGGLADYLATRREDDGAS